MVQCHIVSNIVSIWKWRMVNNGPTLHCDKDYLDMEMNHDQAWSSMIQCRFVTSIVSKWKCTMDNHGQPCLFRVYNIYVRVYIPWVCNINPFDHGWAWCNVALRQILCHYRNKKWPKMVKHVCLSVYNIYIGVYIPWIHIIHLGVILFVWVTYFSLGLIIPSVFSINSLGFIIPLVFRINSSGLLFPWVYNVNNGRLW